jgi:hypothetical protein
VVCTNQTFNLEARVSTNCAAVPALPGMMRRRSVSEFGCPYAAPIINVRVQASQPARYTASQATVRSICSTISTSEHDNSLANALLFLLLFFTAAKHAGAHCNEMAMASFVAASWRASRGIQFRPSYDPLITLVTVSVTD